MQMYIFNFENLVRIVIVQKIVFDFQCISFKVKTQSLFSLFCAKFNFWSKKVDWKVSITFEIMDLKKRRYASFAL